MIKNRKLFLVPLLCILLAVIGVTVYVHQSRTNQSTEYKAKTELMQKCLDMAGLLFHSEASEYLGLSDFFRTQKNTSWQTVLDASLDALYEKEDYSGLGLHATLQKNDSSKEAWLDARGDYRGISLISGRASLTGSVLRLQVPKIYKNILVLDTEALSELADNSIISIAISQLLDPSILKNLNYDVLLGEKSLLDFRNVLRHLAAEFQELYPEDYETINKNITVTRTASGYTLTLKEKALKIFVSDIGNFLFDSSTIHSIWVTYLNQKYKTDPYLSEYYSLAEYREQYLSVTRESVTDTTNIIADLIHFDVPVEFQLDDSGNICSISYEQKNDNLSVVLNMLFTPTGNALDCTGLFSVNVLDTMYEMQFSKDTKISDSDLTLSVAASAKQDGKTLFSSDIVSLLDKKSLEQTITYTGFYDSDTVACSTAIDWSKKTGKQLDILLQHLNIQMNQTVLLSLSGECSISPLDAGVSSLKGKEYDILNLNLSQLRRIVSEITENLKHFKSGLQG